jgi:hypothetical protein
MPASRQGLGRPEGSGGINQKTGRRGRCRKYRVYGKATDFRSMSQGTAQGMTRSYVLMVPGVVEVGNKGFHHIRHLLVGGGVGLRLLGEIIGHHNHKVSVSLVAVREGSGYVDDCSLQWNPDILMHQASAPGSHATTGYAGVAVIPLPSVVSCMEPVVP